MAPLVCFSRFKVECWVLVLLSQCGDGSGTQLPTHWAEPHLGSLYTLVIADAMRLRYIVGAFHCCASVELLPLVKAQSQVPHWHCWIDVWSWPAGNGHIRMYFLSLYCCETLKFCRSLKDVNVWEDLLVIQTPRTLWFPWSQNFGWSCGTSS